MSKVEILAREFSRQLLKDIGELKLGRVIERNVTYAKDHPNDSICASHDFCDPNMVMAAAFKRLGFDTKDVSLWNAAWDMAKASEFYATESGS